MDTQPGETTAEHLIRIMEMLKGAGIHAWVHGGWALEALTGVSRPHSDIDLLAAEKTRADFKRLFAGKIKHEASHKLEIDVDGADVEPTFYKGNGPYYTITPRVVMLWPANVFDESVKGKINGVEIPLVSPVALYALLANTVLKKPPMLEKNRRDLELMNGLLTPEQKKAAEVYFPMENTFLNRLRIRMR